MDSLHFTLEVRATGWVGFGVATQAPNSMTYYDVAVGGVVNGSGYLKVSLLFKLTLMRMCGPLLSEGANGVNS